MYLLKMDHVTPYAGVWIEIDGLTQLIDLLLVTPYAGVWIEIIQRGETIRIMQVTPYAGVWIEITWTPPLLLDGTSLPTRECGLK